MYDSATIARFWAKVNKSGPVPAHCPELGPCWIWTGAQNHAGYGCFVVDGRRVLAHRFGYLLDRNEEPDKPCVCHHCDNRICVRGDHLFCGTRADNNIDMIQKGRRRGATMPGTMHMSAKLNDAAVLNIRQQYSSGAATIAELAREYGVTDESMWLVVHGYTWKHVQLPAA
jgi:hypothetical protein